MNIDLLLISLILFTWCNLAWQSFLQLNVAKLRKTENKNLASKIGIWLSNKSNYHIIFRASLFFIVSVISLSVFSILHETLPNYYCLKNGQYSLDTFHSILLAIIITFILVILSESVIKILAIKFDIQILTFSMPVIKVLNNTLLKPTLAIIGFLKKQLRLHNLEAEKKETVEDQIISLIENNSNAGEKNHLSIKEEEKQMIKNIFELDDTYVREIMTPRVDIVALRANATIDEAIDLFLKSGYSRIPIYTNTLNEIVGIIYTKDFLDKNNLENKTLEQLAHKPFYIPESKNTTQLLKDFKDFHNHFSVVLDEYGETAGIATIWDVLEEIVGEISNRDATQFSIDNGAVIVNARTKIDDINKNFNIILSKNEGVDTIAGLVCLVTGRIPEQGEEILVENKLCVKILKADKKKIITLKIKPIENKLGK